MSTDPTITHDLRPFFRIHASGHVERYLHHDFVPPAEDPDSGVVSRDVVIPTPTHSVSARIFLPKAAAADRRKLPLIIYIHGGAFSIQSAFSSLYHGYVNSLAFASGSVAVSIEYRLAPEHPIPACYDDSDAAIKWVGSHARPGQGPDPWLNEHADFRSVYIAGDSAGANIAHNMVMRAAAPDDGFGFRFSGLILVHPFFGLNGKPNKLWNCICPDTTGLSDTRLYPTVNLDLLSGLGCDRLLVCVAEKDFLRERGRNYYHGLKQSNWRGFAEFFETPGEEHVFHLLNPNSDRAAALMDRIVGFMKSGPAIQSHC